MPDRAQVLFVCAVARERDLAHKAAREHGVDAMAEDLPGAVEYLAEQALTL